MKQIALEKEKIAKAEADAAAKEAEIKTRREEVETKSKELDEYLRAERARIAKHEEENKKDLDARQAELKAETEASQAAHSLAEKAYATKMAELEVMSAKSSEKVNYHRAQLAKINDE